MTDIVVPEVIDARTWATPVSGLTDRAGNARFNQSSYGRGYYRMEDVGGVDYYEVRGGRLPVTQLQRREVSRATHRGRWSTWMVDDPLHWYAMRERVMDLPAGSLIVAGLGLGLFAHHLVDRPDIGPVTIVEIDPDVVNLVGPTIPSDPRFTIVTADYYRHIEQAARPDSILWDLAVGDPEQTKLEFWRALILTQRAYPGIRLSCFGLRDRAWSIVQGADDVPRD